MDLEEGSNASDLPLPPQPKVTNHLSTLSVSWDPGPGIPLSPDEVTVYQRGPGGTVRVLNADDTHLLDLITYDELPWWRRKITRKPRA